jgi:hypothetical protein
MNRNLKKVARAIETNLYGNVLCYDIPETAFKYVKDFDIEKIADEMSAIYNSG